MDKTLQDLAWSVLPKEFKEEAKKLYAKFYNEELPSDCSYGYLGLLIRLFGLHNLTSDEVGEEMLIVPRKQVQQQYKRASLLQDDSDLKWNLVGDQIARVLSGLFCSKCLPDDTKDDTKEPNVASSDVASNVASSKPKPAEPKEEYRNLLQNIANCDKCPKSVQKRTRHPDFGHSRLNIAAMVIASIMGSNDWTDYRGGTNEDVWRNMAKVSLKVADALMNEAEKGGEDGNL